MSRETIAPFCAAMAAILNNSRWFVLNMVLRIFTRVIAQNAGPLSWCRAWSFPAHTCCSSRLKTFGLGFSHFFGSD
jgi:hypothetical protein